MKIAENITELVGGTPLVRLGKIGGGERRIYGKLESFNPCSSVKDRIGKAMIEKAESEGLIDRETVIVEPTSGNTGIGLAFVCAQRGYRLILTMPESMSVERRKLLKRLGAEVVLTAPDKGMNGAVSRAREIMSEHKKSFMPQQFENPANPDIHYRSTGPEIWRQTDGSVDVFVAGVGTGGTVSGVGKYLKEQNENVKIIAVEPEDSPVISGGAAGPHRIQGIGAGFIPANLDQNVVDDVVTVSNEEAFTMSQRLAEEEGILAGISAGANVAAAFAVSGRKELANSMVVTVICDTGERYLSLWSE